jgi:hypothetical protein
MREAYLTCCLTLFAALDSATVLAVLIARAARRLECVCAETQ